MVKIQRVKTSMLFRYLVAPALFLCAIFRGPLWQWAAVIAVGVWLLAAIAQAVWKFAKGRKRRPRKASPDTEQRWDSQGKDPGLTGLERDLFLIRQVNYRITEQLKSAYPMVSWLWVGRPTAEQLARGGTFRIRTVNTEPFNFGEVVLEPTGALHITMLQATSLKDSAAQAAEEADDLRREELLERTDVRTWYREEMYEPGTGKRGNSFCAG